MPLKRQSDLIDQTCIFPRPHLLYSLLVDQTKHWQTFFILPHSLISLSIHLHCLLYFSQIILNLILKHWFRPSSASYYCYLSSTFFRPTPLHNSFTTICNSIVNKTFWASFLLHSNYFCVMGQPKNCNHRRHWTSIFPYSFILKFKQTIPSPLHPTFLAISKSSSPSQTLVIVFEKFIFMSTAT